MKTRRLLAGASVAAGLALTAGVPAGAHVSADKDSVAAGSYTAITLTVPHGCEESPTRELTVTIPAAILNAAPQVVAGWDASTVTEPVQVETEGGGTSETERVASITWTAQAGNELPPGYRQVFTIGFKAPDEVGERLFFGVDQTCVEGSVAWTEETAAGAEEPEHPAPFVDVTEAEGDGHGASDDATTTTVAADDAAAAPAAAATGDDGSDDSSTGLAVVALVVGVLGLAAGVAALLRTRSA